MNPIWFIVRTAGIALITAGGATLMMKKLAPKASDLVAGAIHFKKALNEFQKGARTILFGPPEPTTPEAIKARKESARIRIQ
jgi:hypothetical protein